MTRGSGKDRSRRAETNRATVLIALGACVVGIGILWLATWPIWSDAWTSIWDNVGGLVIATGLLTAAWELIGKRSFAAEVLAKARLSTDVVAAGIQRASDQYLQYVEWDSLFGGAGKVDIVVAYGATWRNAQRVNLEKVAANKRGRIRVFLPDPDDVHTMKTLAERFSTDPDSVSARIREAITDFSTLKVANGADVRVHVRSGDVVFSCYRFDGRAVLTLYSHSRERRSRVPTFVVGSGSVYDFVYDEIQAISEQSRQVFP